LYKVVGIGRIADQCPGIAPECTDVLFEIFTP
jgi:hypothetical protein